MKSKDEMILKAVRESRHETIEQLVSIIGDENTAKLIETFSGCQLHVPLVETIIKNQRNERIYADFSNSRTFRQLSVTGCGTPEAFKKKFHTHSGRRIFLQEKSCSDCRFGCYLS